MEAVQEVVKLVPQVRVPGLSVEQAVSLAPRGRGQQQIAEQRYFNLMKRPSRQ